MDRRIVLAIAVALAGSGLGSGCHAGKPPELRVLGIHEEPRQDIVFMQVTNPAKHSMRLTKLEYRFAAGGATVSRGEMSLAREVPPGAAVVVEIPVDNPSEQPMIMSGKLTAELERIVQIFSVTAQVDPPARAAVHGGSP